MGNFGDRMHMGDAVRIKLECGHPNTKLGEQCAKCGKLLPPTAEEIRDESKSGASKPGAG